MQFAVARGNMSILARQAKQGHLDNIGISMDDFRKVVDDVPWLLVDRNRVFSTLNCLVTAASDVQGIPRFQLPAEWLAAGIAMFVSPINHFAACDWMQRAPTSEELGRGVDDPVPCTAAQLFALTTQLISDPLNSSARVLFERNTSISIDRSKMMEGSKFKEKEYGKT